MFIALAIADLLMAAVFAWKFTSLPPQIPLFYSQLWGENQLVDLWLIVLLPVLLHIFFFLNNFIYHRYFWQDHTIKHILKIANIFFIVAFTLVFLKIIFLVS